MIKIINYGVGNIDAFINIYKNLGIDIGIASKSDDLAGTTKLILPGVGHFDYAMLKFKQTGMLNSVNNLVLNMEVPVLGICVGMQIMAHSSEEGYENGLSWIDADVRRIPENSTNIYKNRLPHMGWNDVRVISKNQITNSLEERSKFYFLHSYYFHCNSPDDVIAITDYGNDFPCIINNNNIYGVQFHPEKSHQFGIKLLENFYNLNA